MRRRPFVIAAFILCALILLLRAAGVPLRAVPAGQACAELEIRRTGAVDLRGTVSEWDIRDGCSILVLKQCEVLADEAAYRVGGVRVSLYGDGREHFSIGTKLLLHGEPEVIIGAENPGQFDASSYYRNQGIRYRMRDPEIVRAEPAGAGIRELLARLRHALRNRIRSVYPEEEAGILSAMLLGDKTMLTDESRSLWRNGGILHMLSISGMHLTLLGMGLFALLRKMTVPLKAAAALSGAFMLFYTVFTGMSLPAVRALLMCSLVLLAKVTGRVYDPPTALSLCALLMLAENPEYLFYSGFQMSFAALVIVELFSERGKLPTAVMLYLGMLPIILESSFETSVYSMAVNLIAVPFLPAILVGGLIGMAGGGPAALPAGGILRGLNVLLEWTSRLPAASLILGKPGPVRILVYYALLVLWAAAMKRYRLWKRRFFLYLAVPLLVGVIGFRTRDSLKMTFLSVGQGDGIVLEMPGGANVMIDGGSSSESAVGEYRILPFLKSEGISRIDYAFVTHMDGDHISGIREMLEDMVRISSAVRIRTLVLPYSCYPGDSIGLPEESEISAGGDVRSSGAEAGSSERTFGKDADAAELAALAGRAGCRVLYAGAGDRFAFGAVQIDVMGPSGTGDLDSNSSCLVLGIHYGEFDALMTGDVSGEGEERLIRRLVGEARVYDVLKVAHHGSKYSTPAELLSVIRPGVGIISCGRGNRYGHPHVQLLTRLREAGAEIFRTDERGAVTVSTDGKLYKVSCFLPAQDIV